MLLFLHKFQRRVCKTKPSTLEYTEVTFYLAFVVQEIVSPYDSAMLAMVQRPKGSSLFLVCRISPLY